MFCLCAGLCLYLGFCFRYFPYSLYTFQPQIAVINVAATKSELHAHVLVGLARRWHSTGVVYFLHTRETGVGKVFQPPSQ